MTRFPKFDFAKMKPATADHAKMRFPGLDPTKMGYTPFGGPASGGGERAARMAEAMVELQRRQAAALARWAEARRQPDAAPDGDRHGATLDMEAPTTEGGAWTAPGAAPGSDPDRTRTPAAAPFDLSSTMRGLRESLAASGIPGAVIPEFKMPDGLMPDAVMAGAARPAAGAFGAEARAPDALPPGARFEARTFSSAVGSRSYKVYVPSGYVGQPLPVVVMLHGCSQNPDDFAAGTRMNAVAEEHTFLVAYPGQPKSAHLQRCWNWYSEGDQRRDGGEPALIAGIARQVIAEFSADPKRVYVAGLSAGGAAAAILAATYPDLFAAAGVHSGLACGVARDLPSALSAMKGGGAAPSGRHTVPTIVFHGDADRTVHPVNGEQVAVQSAATPDLAPRVEHGRTADGVAYTRTVRTDASGRAVQEHWVLHGMGHAWSGGSQAGSYTDARGPDASREMARFFLAHARP